VQLSEAARSARQEQQDDDDDDDGQPACCSQQSPSEGSKASSISHPSKKPRKSPAAPSTSEVASVLSQYLAQSRKEQEAVNFQVIIYGCSLEIP